MDDDINRYPMLHPILRPSKVGAVGTHGMISNTAISEVRYLVPDFRAH
jgi:hypothetical protein